MRCSLGRWWHRGCGAWCGTCSCRLRPSQEGPQDVTSASNLTADKELDQDDLKPLIVVVLGLVDDGVAIRQTIALEVVDNLSLSWGWWCSSWCCNVGYNLDGNLGMMTQLESFDTDFFSRTLKQPLWKLNENLKLNQLKLVRVFWPGGKDLSVVTHFTSSSTFCYASICFAPVISLFMLWGTASTVTLRWTSFVFLITCPSLTTSMGYFLSITVVHKVPPT